MLDIISIHINKTAGKSFRYILRCNYGERLFCINIDNFNGIHRSLSCKSSDLVSMIPEKTKVLHGHFCAKDIVNVIGHAQIITWLRNPIDRVVSNYFHDTNNGYTHLNIDDYVLQENNINKMSKMLAGLRLDKIIIGIQENFNNDVTRIGSMFNWDFFVPPMINVGTKGDVPQKILQLIKDINGDDIDLYNKYNKI